MIADRIYYLIPISDADAETWNDDDRANAAYFCD